MSRTFAIALTAACILFYPTRAPGQAAAPRAVVADGGGSIVIATSESGKTIYGYSIETGVWDGLAVENPGQSRPSPVVGSGIAYVAIDKKIHAFSSATGRWATLDLPEVAQPKLMGSRIRVDLGNKIHMFSGKTGKWAMVDLGVDK
jgi:hypothetical protein